MLGLSVYWIYTAWPAASGAMLLAAVVCSLFANRDNAVAIGLSFLRGIVYAIPAAMLVSQWLLPQWNGFPLLCLAMGVPLFFATLGMAVPVTAGTATSFAIHFIVLVAPRNQMDYNLATLLNSAQGVLIGVGFAVVIFRLLTLRPGWLTRRLLDATCVDLGRSPGAAGAGGELVRRAHGRPPVAPGAARQPVAGAGAAALGRWPPGARPG